MFDDLNDINRVQEAVNVLYENVYDMPAYQYVDPA